MVICFFPSLQANAESCTAIVKDVSSMLMRSWRQHKVDVHPQEAVALQEWTLPLELNSQERELAVSLTFFCKRNVHYWDFWVPWFSEHPAKISFLLDVKTTSNPGCWTWFESATTRADAVIVYCRTLLLWWSFVLCGCCCCCCCCCFRRCWCFGGVVGKSNDILQDLAAMRMLGNRCKAESWQQNLSVLVQTLEPELSFQGLDTLEVHLKWLLGMLRWFCWFNSSLRFPKPLAVLLWCKCTHWRCFSSDRECMSLPSVAVYHGARLEDREWKMELLRSTPANCSLLPRNQALRMVGQLSEICLEELQERKKNGQIGGKKSSWVVIWDDRRYILCVPGLLPIPRVESRLLNSCLVLA